MFIFWLLAVVLVVVGIYFLVTGRILAGIVLIIVGLLVGPGGVSIFDDDDGDGRNDVAPLVEAPPGA
jgi:hypothetical protein